ncbi:related to Probable pectate lyase F [Armillaria ostoyae]|uniref:Pectate lyase n=1 Tax=Armillaria ostoyae TaxID=47428 RepID=A0A284RZ99_ARMOS|nr:related to Probable pectate lyase F [Armillaria ostoyae]
MACDAYIGGLPTATGTVSSKAVIEVATGKVFDGGWKNYDCGSGACRLSKGYWEDAEIVVLIFAMVFYLHEGALLQNVIIGANQAEGVRTSFLVRFRWAFSQPLSCTRLYRILHSEIFIQFEDICDAITIKINKASDYTNIIGGGAYYAEDKVIQHNDCGTVNIINFFVSGE